jgi:mannose-6-phosphate isomerase-like protein (cupin superfamily)
VFVAANADATGTEHHGPRAGTHLDFKVLTRDTQDGFFLIEHRNVPQGGPVRHLHYAQEEWFYLIDSNKVVIEVGDERFTLRPGDSILSPRNVPHVWAYVGEKPGRMLMGFTPAGQMEDFFTLSSKQPVDAKSASCRCGRRVLFRCEPTPAGSTTDGNLNSVPATRDHGNKFPTSPISWTGQDGGIALIELACEKDFPLSGLL